MINYLPEQCYQPALQRLDLMLYREILRLRAVYQLSLDEFRGLYVSDSQVDALIRQWSNEQQHDDNVENLSQLIAELEPDCRAALSNDSRWRHMLEQFQLSPVEQDVLLLALAPELALKYETLYAYLNNDITRKYPTVELASRLLTDGDQQQCRQRLSPVATLIREQLLEPVGDNNRRWSLASGFNVSPSVLSYLLDGVPIDARLIPGSRYMQAGDITQTPVLITTQLPPMCPGRLMVLEGEPGAGRLLAVSKLLVASQKNVLTAVLPMLTLAGEPLSSQLQRLLLQAQLAGAGLYLTGLDKLMVAETNDRRHDLAALAQLQQTQVPVFLEMASGALWRQWLAGSNVCSQVFDDPDLIQRQQLWQAAVIEQQLPVSAQDVQAVADRFVLNPGQISAAVMSLGAQLPNDSNTQAALDREAVFAVAREQSIGDIGKLASKVCTTHNWEDLVLPTATMQRVNEAVAAITNRGLVYQQWQMQQRTGGSSGLVMMFSGSSGTGKTMCAGLMAQAVGFDLYCIDLSSVVSKYIGETEKNLDRIFTAARRANCILFFDEADALFGKRSEVKDAHDRYANVEVAYLLQKMESHNGVVIMATNIAKNIDSAFSRRLHYSIEFPRPNAEHRERLWRGIYPVETPLAEDVDFVFLGRNFEGAGGDIKTIALDAAMQAAGNGQQVTMSCLIKAMARQMIKQGKAPSAADFKHYYSLIESSAEAADPGHQNRPGRRVVQHPTVRGKY